MVAVRLNAYLKWEKVEKESEKRVIIINVFFSSTGKVDGDFLLFSHPAPQKNFPQIRQSVIAQRHTEKKINLKEDKFPIIIRMAKLGPRNGQNWGHEMGPTRQVCCRALNWTKNCVSCREPPRRKLQIISSIDFDKNLAGRAGFYTTLRLLGFGKVTWIGGKKMRAIEHL